MQSISSQHKKQGSTHQILACATERGELFNLPVWGRCWHLYCGKSSIGGNPLYPWCCGWRYWYIDPPYPSLWQLKNDVFSNTERGKSQPKRMVVEYWVFPRTECWWLDGWYSICACLRWLWQYQLFIAKVSYFTYFLRLCPCLHWKIELQYWRS